MQSDNESESDGKMHFSQHVKSFKPYTYTDFRTTKQTLGLKQLDPVLKFLLCKSLNHAFHQFV